jgi:hypothetical protein
MAFLPNLVKTKDSVRFPNIQSHTPQCCPFGLCIIFSLQYFGFCMSIQKLDCVRTCVS